ncbi:MAG: hypothetical protein EAX90_01780 [Candidatus Heimdallarchaeota archaeon]|nr:hypothetical protein [Candidatus Heimdallarchaeota archaeon]
MVLIALILSLIYGILALVVMLVARKEFSAIVFLVSGGVFLGSFIVIWLALWFTLPVVGTIIAMSFLLAGIGIIVLLRYFSRNFGRIGRDVAAIITLVFAGGMILTPVFFFGSSTIYRGYDTARYFDTIIEFTDAKMPFNNIVTGDHLRVVDSDLAAEIIQKSSPFGSNTEIQELHVGKINGKLMWIGVIGSDSIKIGTDNAGRKRNSIFGFVGVDLTDPSKDVVVINQTGVIGSYLARTKMLSRVLMNLNPNYVPGDNSYYSMNEAGYMRLLVPYSISTSWKIENTNGIAMTTYLNKMGGVLEFDLDGNLVKDYKVLSELPKYAQIQCYPEDWLEYNINKWGRHRKGNHEFQYFFTTTEQLGISWYDDIRVIYDANTGETSQYVMLTQPESESQLLRGAIKANVSGIYFFDWSNLQPKPIDTYNALVHCNTKIEDQGFSEGFDADNYYPILPLLYPIRERYNNMSDYAYIVPVQVDKLRFGGIALTNPYDPGGAETYFEKATALDTVETVLIRAIDEYLKVIGEEDITTSNYTETLEISEITSFEKEGNTIYVAYGNLTYLDETFLPLSENQTVWFTQDYLNTTQWETVLFLEVGDTLKLHIVFINDIFFCREIISVI